MYSSVAVGSWVDIHDGCPIRFEVCGSGVAFVTCGPETADNFQFMLESEALREFLRVGCEALREMDALHTREEAGGAPS